MIITGLSGSGKGSVLKALEDLGYYSVDNLPVDLIPKFAELTQDSASIRAAALVVDVREGEGLKRFPGIYARIRNSREAGWCFWKPTTTPSCAASARRAGRIRWAPTTPSPRASNPERRQLAPIRAHGGPDHQHLQVHRSRAARLHPREASGASATSPRSWCTSPASAIATACRRIATWSSTCASCRIRTTFRASRS